MAGATAATFPPNPFQSPTPPKTLTPKPFSLRFQCPKPSVSLVTLRATITARYGGGFRPNSGDSRRPRDTRQSDFDPDPALDLSTIRSPSVRLIDAQQNMVGIVPKREAVQLSEDAGLDLVILSPDADPPVVKIMDYKKYRYELQKKKREQQKKSAASRVDIKEVKMGYNIDSHDYSVRLRAAQRFLNDGDKVKVIVNLKGRQNEFRNIAIELIKRFQNDIGEDRQTGKVIGMGNRHGRLFLLNMGQQSFLTSSSSLLNNMWTTWHKHLGHLNNANLSSLFKLGYLN